MLQKEFRFHGYSSLRFVYRVGKTVRSRSFSVRYAPNPRRQHTRCAVTISRKVIKSAPKRNRVRRRIYELLRTHWHHIPPSHDIVISVYEPRVVDMPHAELLEALTDVLARADLWHKDQNTVQPPGKPVNS